MLTLLSPSELCNESSISVAVRSAAGIVCRTSNDCSWTVRFWNDSGMRWRKLGADGTPDHTLHCSSAVFAPHINWSLLCHLLRVNCVTGAASCLKTVESCKLQPSALNCLFASRTVSLYCLPSASELCDGLPISVWAAVSISLLSALITWHSQRCS